MNVVLADALAQLHLQPGQCQRVRVDGYEVEIRRLAEEASDYEDAVGPDLWINVPPSPAARTITITRGPAMLPLPLRLDESDLAPE